MAKSVDDFLRQRVFLFETLTDQQAQLLLECSTTCAYPAGTLLFHEGDQSDRFSVVLEGELEIIQAFGGESERLLNVLGPGSILGETSLFDTARLRTASARARSDLTMFEIPAEHFEALVRSTPQMAFQIMQVLTGRLLNNERKTIAELRESNRMLAQSLRDLQAAQQQLLEKERLETELATARKIQESMLPDEVPILPGWTISAHWQPAREVSGDFYDFIPLPDGRMALVVGDVTDKGVPAALVMTVTRSVLRTAALQAASPGALLAQVNDILADQLKDSMFVTSLVGYLDPASGLVEIANAGHCLPLVASGRRISELNVRGMALGLFGGQVYQPVSLSMQPGDRLLFYSDGLTEAHDRQGIMFGSQQIKALVDTPPGQLVIPALLQQLNDFTGPQPEREDDLTLLALERN